VGLLPCGGDERDDLVAALPCYRLYTLGCLGRVGGHNGAEFLARRKKERGLELECLGHRVEGVKGRALVSELDVGNRATGETASVREFGLRQAQRLSLLADAPSNKLVEPFGVGRSSHRQRK